MARPTTSPAAAKQLESLNAQSWTALFRAFRSHRQPSASLIKVIPQLEKTLGRTGQTLRACTVAEALEGINDFSLVFLSTTSEKSFILYKDSATVQALKVCPVRPRVFSSWGITLIREAEGCR